MPSPVYVETRIRGPMSELWARTQQPELHQRWDLRFTSITYLARSGPAAPQRFRYSTRIGFGLAISGEGETTATRDGPDGRRTSALSFWSEHPLSLIERGAGYWQYVPTDDGIRFLTRYDYTVRWGPPGRLLDKMIFRPLIGWATAWSFDRLRLWIEQDIAPEESARCALTIAGSVAAPAVLMLVSLVSRGRFSARLPAAVVPLAMAGVAVLLRRSLRGVPLARRCLRRPGDRA